MTREQQLEAALRPFADAVYNDNGDVTIDTSHLHTRDYMKARAALTSPPAPVQEIHRDFGEHDNPPRGRFQDRHDALAELRRFLSEQTGDPVVMGMIGEILERVDAVIAALPASIAIGEEEPNDPEPIPVAEVEAEAQRVRKMLDEGVGVSDMLYAGYCALLMVLGYNTAPPSEMFKDADDAPPADSAVVGKIVAWMREQAQRHIIEWAGSVDADVLRRAADAIEAGDWKDAKP